MLTRTPPIYVVVPGPGLPHRRAGRHAHARSSTRSRAWWWTRASRWPTSRARWTTSPGRCSARRRGPGWRPHYFPFTEPSAEFDVWFPQAPRRPALGRVGRLRHGQPARAAGLRHRPRGLLWLRVRHGHRAHADVPQRGDATCATWSRATCGSPARSAWRCSDDEGSPCPGCASTSTAADLTAEALEAALVRPRHRGRGDRRPARAVSGRAGRRPGRRHRGADRVQEADPVLPGRRRRQRHRRAAGDRLRRHQLRRGRPGRGDPARRRAARRVRHRVAQDLRPQLQRHDLLGPRAGHQRRPRRHHRARPGHSRRRQAGRRRAARSSAWTTSWSS